MANILVRKKKKNENKSNRTRHEKLKNHDSGLHAQNLILFGGKVCFRQFCRIFEVYNKWQAENVICCLIMFLQKPLGMNELNYSRGCAVE